MIPQFEANLLINQKEIKIRIQIMSEKNTHGSPKLTNEPTSMINVVCNGFILAVDRAIHAGDFKNALRAVILAEEA